MARSSVNPVWVATCEQFRIEFPEELPISQHIEEIKQAWSSNSVIIVGGDTGSGKTTQLPKIALSLGAGRYGLIGCTQPRRIAASAMSRRVAQELGCELGTGVGYQVRFEDRTTKSTVLKFMTDGILLAETRTDRQLRQYEAIIIDEAHERSLNIDFLLGYLKNLRKIRPELKVAISSATLDTEEFSKFFDNAPVISIEGRTYPIEDVFMPPECDEELDSHVARAVDFVSELDPQGDILVFLPGEQEIRDTADVLNGRQLRNTEVLPLFGRLSNADQQKVFNPGRMRRIVLATNVAETSVTIPRIRFVIDSAQARIKRFNARTQIEELQVETISQASARQRRGRCGRIANGVCVHLQSEDDLKRAAPYTDPEIKRTSLAGVILQMAVLGLPRITNFPFINPPSPVAVREGLRTLEDLQALDPTGRPTRDGKKLAELPIDPQLGRMLAYAEQHRLLPELLVITAFLSIRDPQERPIDKILASEEAHRKFQDSDSDFMGIIRLWNAIQQECSSHRQLRVFARKNFYNFSRLMEWRNLVSDLAKVATNLKWRGAEVPKILEKTPYDLLHQSILAGIPRHIAQYQPEERRYRGTSTRQFQIFPGSGLYKRKPPPEWLMSFALVETNRLYARQNALIKPSYIEKAASHLCTKLYDHPRWDPASGFVYARLRLSLGGLLIHNGRQVLYSVSHPKEAREIFIREALATGMANVPGTWLAKNAHIHRELTQLEIKLRRPGTVLDSEAIVTYYLDQLPSDIHSIKSVLELARTDPRDYCIPLDVAMQEQFWEWDIADYPDSLEFSGQEFSLRYTFAPGESMDGITLMVPSEQLSLIPRIMLDWLIPGYLADKVELMLRSLPKAIRKELFPLMETATNFCQAVKSGNIFKEQPLEVALTEFLQEKIGTVVTASDFSQIQFPEHLILKIAELNANGKILKIHRELPTFVREDSRLSIAVPQARHFNATGYTTWPAENYLPEVIELSNNKVAYAALHDEGNSIGKALYMNEAEARINHQRGIIRLFRLENVALMKYLRSSLKFSNQAMLSWFLDYHDGIDDLIDLAIVVALGTDLWKLRDQTAYEIGSERARSEVGTGAIKMAHQLDEYLINYQFGREAIKKIQSQSPDSAADMERHLSLLFRKHFLKSMVVFEDYPRYLRGVRIRAERAIASPGRDEKKLDTISGQLDRLHLAVESVPELTSKPLLHDLWQLTEECRLAVFAPEVPLAIRSPLKKWDKTWEEVKL